MQMPHCCVCATLQMIFYRQGLDIMTQEEIGAELGLRMPLRMRELFTDERIKWLSDDSKENFGTRIRKKGCRVNDFFGRHGIALKISKLYRMNSVENIDNFLCQNLSDEVDIIVSSMANLRTKRGYELHGHFALVDGADFAKEIVYVCDSDIPHWKEVTFSDLVYRMSGEIDRRVRGFYKVVCALGASAMSGRSKK